ncbi:MAG: hypothetical protein WCD00_09030 [Desulfuromonadaceae bacterium]
MIRTIDSHRLDFLHGTPCNYASPADLRREGRVFFIGGNLPVYSTLETMYESYCLEATDLFHVTFGDVGAFGQNLDMVRQIKRNFSIRLMGQIGYPLSASQVEQVYLAGLDVLDIPQQAYGSYPVAGAVGDGGRWRETFGAAAATFSSWSVASSIIADHAAPEDIRAAIHELLGHGVIPLLVLAGEGSAWDPAETGDLFLFLAAEWHRHRVPLKPIMPLLRLTTPFEFTASSGFLREVFDKLQDRRTLAASDIRRHLRTSGAVGSFESAGL